MTRRLVYRPKALDEISKAAEWYEERKAGLGAKFLQALDATIASVEHEPLQHPSINPRMRRALLRRFPYSLIFSVFPEEIAVLACVHWRQSPERWKHRQ